MFFLIFDALLEAVFCIGIVARALSIAALTGLVTALRTTVTTLLLTSVAALTGLITTFARLICALTGLVASLFAIVIIAGTYVTALTGLIVSTGLIAAMLGTRLLTSLLKTGSEALGTEAALLGFAASVGAVSTCGMDTGALRATRSCLILSLITRRTCITFAAVFCTLALLLCRVLIFLF